MYCGQCGKKVMENMLFCPFCGSPIVVPDQNETTENASVEASGKTIVSAVAPIVEKNEARRDAQRPVSLFDDLDEMFDHEVEKEIEQKPFVPFSFDAAVDFAESEEKDTVASEQSAQAAASLEQESQSDMPEVVPANISPEFIDRQGEHAPSKRPNRRNVPELTRPEQSRRRPNTYIPIKELDPDDIFMDGYGDTDDFDDYDADDYDMPAASDDRYEDDDEFDFEEPESGSFFQRHIRGIVGLVLLLMVAVICLLWAVSGKGQLALAQANLAWTAQPYADLGYQAYQQDSHLLAARYYEKALSRDNENYEYAHSAMVAYYEANETESAAAMLKKCIELKPDDPEPYREMLILYPDAQTRPWDISELVRQGYQRTGDTALKQD